MGEQSAYLADTAGNITQKFTDFDDNAGDDAVIIKDNLGRYLLLDVNISSTKLYYLYLESDDQGNVSVSKQVSLSDNLSTFRAATFSDKFGRLVVSGGGSGASSIEFSTFNISIDKNIELGTSSKDIDTFAQKEILLSEEKGSANSLISFGSGVLSFTRGAIQLLKSVGNGTNPWFAPIGSLFRNVFDNGELSVKNKDGSFSRIGNHVLNINTFGAHPTKTGTENRIAIQRALDAAVNYTDKVTVIIPRGESQPYRAALPHPQVLPDLGSGR